MASDDLDRKRREKLYHDRQAQGNQGQHNQVQGRLADYLRRPCGAAGMPFFLQRPYFNVEEVEEVEEGLEPAPA